MELGFLKKKLTLHPARSRHLLTILWHFFPLAMFANFPGGPKMNLSAVCFTPFALFPLYLPHHALQEQFFGYCSRLTPVCLSARGPVYIHPICLIPYLHLTDITLLVIAILIEINPHHHHIGFQLQLTLTNLLLVRFPYLFHLLRVIACTVSVN